MIRLYSNENFDFQVVQHLRHLGFDVLTAFEAGNANQRIPDELVLAFAISENRALLTFNRKDFFKLHKSVPDHTGIIACTYDANYERLANRINQEITTAGKHLSRKLIRVYRPA